MKTSFFRAIALSALASVCCSPGAQATAPLVMTYNRDASGRLTGVNYGSSSHTAFAYDNNGALLARADSTNPFPALLGSYYGVVTSGSPDNTNTGTIALTVTSSGAFTGTLVLGAAKFPLLGSFDTNGNAHLNVTPKAPAAPFALDLSLDLTGATSQIDGYLSGGATAGFAAVLAPFNKKSYPLPSGLVGAYTAILNPALSGTGIPQGTGFGTVSVGADGSVKFVGTLADGTKLTQGAMITGDEVWPFFLPLYKSGGLLVGSAAFTAEPGVSDFSGSLTWIKPATAGPLYPGAFNTSLELLGSKYVAPAKTQLALSVQPRSPNLIFSAIDGGLPAPTLIDLITLGTGNKVAAAIGDPAKFKLVITSASGLLSGSFFDGGASHNFSGVIFQRQNFGAGFFIGTSTTGPFTLAPAP